MQGFDFQFERKSYGIGIALLAFVVMAFLIIEHVASEGDEVNPPVTFPEKKEVLLTTMYRHPEAYEVAFASAQAVIPDVSVRAVITSHHFLAAPLIAKSFASVANPSITRIILVSPDHFNTKFDSGELAFTVDSDWDALSGVLSADRHFIARLEAGGFGVRNAKLPFLGEHGIYTEIPFVKRYFPQADIVPLIMKNDFNYEDFLRLGASIRSVVGADFDTTLVVISSDFSHHASHASALMNDTKSIEVLNHLDERRFGDLQNDCRSCIALLSGYLQSPSDFHLIEQKDSTDFGGEDRDVTSYVSGFFTPQKKKVDDMVTLLFGGDIMFDRSIRTAMRKRGNDFPLEPLKDLFAKSDLVIANLEGPITDNSSRSEGSVIGSRENYFFTFDPSVAKTLKDASVGMVNLGNNHILNFGEDGVAQTKKYLKETGVEYFGSPTDTEHRYWVRDVKGVKIAFVNYNQFIANGKEKALSDIAEAKMKSDFVVLYTHWGKEYVPALPSVKDLAHEFVSAGADLIIGSHPHIIQEHEVYQGKRIYYSLGNLVFDQYGEEATKNGLLVRASIDTATKNVALEEIPVFMKTNGQTTVGGGH